MDWKTTTTLLNGLEQPGNQAAWDGFLGRFQIPVRSFVLSRGIRAADAEDLVQDILVAFVEMYRDRRYDRERGRLSSWLFGIAQNHVLRFRERGHRHQQKMDAFGVSGSESDPGSWDLWQRHWEEFLLRESLRRAQAETSRRTFAAFELTVLKGHTPEQAATELEIDVKAVYNARHRVLQRMRQLKAEIEGDETADE